MEVPSDGQAPAGAPAVAAVPAPEPAAPPPEAVTPASPAPVQEVQPPEESIPAGDPKPEGDAPAGLKSMLGEESKEKIPAEEGAGGEGDGDAFTVDIPKGFVADTEGVGFLEAKVKDGVLSREAAQELANVHMDGIRRYEANLIANAQKQVDVWEGKIREHPEYGGIKLQESVDNAKLVLQKYGTPAMVEQFKSVGILSHPDFFVFLNKVHAETSDGVSIGGVAQATPETNTAKVMFPDFK